MYGWANKILLLLVIFTLLLVGCQAPSGSTNVESDMAGLSEGDDDSGNDSVLRVRVDNYRNDQEKRLWAEVVARFEELHDDITVELTTGDPSPDSGDIQTMLQSGVTPPDALQMHAGPARVGLLSSAGHIVDLDEWYERNNWKDAMRPFAYEVTPIDGVRYEVPHTTDAIMVYYNKDIFEEHGLEVPETGEEFIKVMETLRDNDVPPIVVGGRTTFALGTLYSNIMEAVAGRDAVEDLIYGDTKWNDPEFVKVAETFLEWTEEGFIAKESPTLTSTDAKFAFLNKQSGMFVSVTHTISDIVDEDLEETVGTFAMPSFVEGKESGPTGGIGYTWVVPKGAENKEGAEKWFNFILSKDFVEVVFNDPSYNLLPAATATEELQPVGELLQSAVKRTENGFGYNPSVFIGREAQEAYYQNITGILAELVEPKEAMDNTEAGAEKDRDAGFSISK